MHRISARSPLAVLAGLACAALLALAATAPSAHGFYRANKRCQGYTSHHIRYVVHRSRGTTCHRARRVTRQFWYGRRVEHHIDGYTDNAHTYWSLPGQPGWKCGTGAGAPGGSVGCSRRNAHVTADGYPT